MNSYYDASLIKVPDAGNSPNEADLPYEVQLTGKKQTFICKLTDCGKSFRYKSEIARHIATHSTFRPYTCTHESCKKSFKRADALENHIRTHTKETPFVCPMEECSQGFTTKASLRYHVLKHKDQKIYKCTYPGCNKAFITIFQLKQHERSACIHQKIKLKEHSNEVFMDTPTVTIPTHKSLDTSKDIPIGLKRPPMVGWEVKAPVPIPKREENPVHLESKVRNILTENQILKQRLEFSQKIITLLQKNDNMQYMDNQVDVMPDASSYYMRPGLYQGQIYE